MAIRKINGLTIRTTHEWPAIPDRRFDWCAVDDDTYEPGCPIGWGQTEQLAIDDLLAEIEEDADCANEYAKANGQFGVGA